MAIPACGIRNQVVPAMPRFKAHNDLAVGVPQMSGKKLGDATAQPGATSREIQHYKNIHMCVEYA